MISYYMNLNLESGSDHHPIFIQFSLKRVLQVVKPYHNWKKIDSEDIIIKV